MSHPLERGPVSGEQGCTGGITSNRALAVTSFLLPDSQASQLGVTMHSVSSGLVCVTGRLGGLTLCWIHGRRETFKGLRYPQGPESLIDGLNTSLQSLRSAPSSLASFQSELKLSY